MFAKYVEDSQNGQESRIDGGSYFINEIELTWNGEVYSPVGIEPSISYDFIEPLFGNTNEVRLTRNETTIFSKSVYFPQSLNLFNFSATDYISNTSAVGVSRSNFNFEWNEDTDNSNGLIIYVRWDGLTVGHGENPTFQLDQPIEKAIKVEDTGSYLCASALFEDIPQNALLSVMFGRGNIIVEKESINHEKDIRISALQLYYFNIGLTD